MIRNYHFSIIFPLNFGNSRAFILRIQKFVEFSIFAKCILVKFNPQKNLSQGTWGSSTTPTVTTTSSPSFSMLSSTTRSTDSRTETRIWSNSLRILRNRNTLTTQWCFSWVITVCEPVPFDPHFRFGFTFWNCSFSLFPHIFLLLGASTSWY